MDWNDWFKLMGIAITITVGFMLLVFLTVKFGESPLNIRDDINQYQGYYVECFKQSEDEVMCGMLAAAHAKKY